MLTRDQKVRIRILAGCHPAPEPEHQRLGVITTEQLAEIGIGAKEIFTLPAYDASFGDNHLFDIGKLENDLDTTKALATKFVNTNRQLYSLGR